MYYYIALAGLIIIDQIIKIVVRSTMSLGQTIPIVGDLFSIKYIENTGMAFGMMSGSRLFLVILPIIAMAIIFFLWKKYGKNYRPVLGIGVIMVIAGGLSNVFDRVLLGSVTDYLSLKWFAVFNFADICACVGCALIVIGIWFFEKKER